MITKVRVDQWEQQMITKMVYQWEQPRLAARTPGCPISRSIG